MAADCVLPGPDEPVSAEIVHQSGRTRITRLVVPGGTVIRKEPLGPDAERRVRHEVAMLERLRGVAGVAQLAGAPRYPGSVVLADPGETNLAGITKPLAAEDLTGLGLGLARAVAEMHRRGVMHRDITPTNVVLSGDGAPCLVDFALASSFAEIRPEFTHHAEIAGTLAYLAPEATGRTGRPVDQRADLYALGAVLYELATGGAPFGAGDPLRLIHDHLARVPAPAADANPALPAPLSGIIMHLLEKEPDNRYQTADGLVYDLEQLRHVRPAAAVFGVGEHDFPARLVPPSRLAGRDDEVAALKAAFAGAVAGQCRGVLVSGAPGVGKTALIDRLRPVVTGGDGWFVAGKFDQYRRDLEFDAAHQAFRALGRLLLAEPEDELARVRGQILRAVGPNAGLLTAVLPEFAALLGVPPDAGDPLTAQVRVQRATAAALRAVASRKRPVVLFLDDLQWAGRTPLGFVDLVLTEEPVEGLLLVGAYRDGDVDAAHPLAAPLARWLDQDTVRHVRLADLAAAGAVTMVAEMLRVDETAEGLAEVIEPHTRGNPYEIVELLNALRRDGLLTVTAAGWRWDEAAVAARLGRSEAAGLATARVAAIPPASRAMVEAMACLGGRAELSLLAAATGEPADVVDQALAPALEEGLLVAEPGARPAVRFRHDRIREAVLGGLESGQRRSVQLAMGRRLAGVPELFAVAAEQYLPVVGAITDAAERRQLAGLLRRAAGQAALTGDYVLVHALLTAALTAVDPGETATLAEVHTGRHAALYCLGRLEEADEEYRTIERLCPAVLDRADATAVQVHSVIHRTRYAEAVGLGQQALRGLGITVPAADRLAAELDDRFGYLYQWLDHTEAADDLARPDLTDPTLLAACGLINATSGAAYFVGDPATVAWLGLEAMRICLEHGPAPSVVGPVTLTALGAVALRGDYATGYRAARRILALAEARGYEPGTSQARMLFALLSCWAEPIENMVHASQRAREALIAAGDLANAGYAYSASLPGMLDCAPSLDRYLTEAEAALAFVRRTGNEHIEQMLGADRWLAGVLLGESTAAAGEAASADKYAGNPLAQFAAHLKHANAAAIFGDQAGLGRHTAATTPLVPVFPGLYSAAVARLLRGLALAGQARTADGDERGDLLAKLDEVTRWLAARAADAPGNFLHLLRLLEAERAWAAGDFRAAALAFDAARREAAQRQRPWHRALIAEHAARFYLAHGLEQAGHDLLAQARQEYLAWGATAKVGQLDWAYPALRTPAEAIASDDGQSGDLPRDRAVITPGTIDLLGIVSASQALSSETSIGRLHARVVQVLSAMTGATGVRLLLWSENRDGWFLPASDADGGTVPVGDTGQDRAVPMSVLRYVQRTREPLVVADAARDDRFARDPYFVGVDCCSLLAVPIVSRGTLRAVLLLENRLLGAAFTAGRLDAVKLIAGQLAVSLDNAQLYAGFRQVVGEQAALRRVAVLVARAAPPEAVFAAVAGEAGRLLGVDVAVLVRYDPHDSITVVGTWTSTGAPPTRVGSQFPLGGNNASTLVFRTGQTARTDHAGMSGVIGDVATRDWGLRSSVGVPIRVEDRLWGVMVVALTQGELLPADAEARLAGFTELVATAIANMQARVELQGSADEQAALRRVATLVARAAPPEEVFATVTAEAGRLLAVHLAFLTRYDPDGTGAVVGTWAAPGGSPIAVGTRLPLAGRNVTSLVFQTGRSVRIDGYADATGPFADFAREAGVRASVGVPISVAGRLWGVMILSSRSEPLPAGTEARLAGFTELAATAIANAQAQAEVAASRARILAASDETRRRIERDLHDGIQQRLVTQALLLSGIRDRVPADVRAEVDQVREEMAATRQELRDLCQGVHPAILVEVGLGAAIRALARRSPLPVRVQVRVDGRLPGSCEVTAYYVAAEAFTNAAKHASASAVDILIEQADGTLTVQVRDDGAGGADASRGSGLTGLRDRVEAVGGSMTVDSPAGAGTVLTVLLPVTTDDH
jgi:signal transduction histidine kinase